MCPPCALGNPQMTNTLLLLSSPRGAASLSTRIATVLADRFAAAPGSKVQVHDLAAEALPHIDPDYAEGRMLPPDQRSAGQAQAVARAEALLDELNAADVVVIASSMINFGPSSILKAWLDHIVWPGRTVAYSETGPKGLLTGKKVYLVIASGGIYSVGPAAPHDFQTPYLKYVLGVIGLTDVEVIRVEGHAYGPEAAEKAISEALSTVAEVAIAA
jgi:FMN-dependent NADH-azoreductase